ncbi:hypothetical protein [Streptomyces sp. NPDC046925]|uniref:hypothetical protein n=1 Tax=Streptomyces sp. NPDC046925 TaxID=3155375 RepID=UPI0033CF4A59
MLLRPTPFPAPLNADDASELAELLGFVVSVSAQSAARRCGLSASFLVSLATRTTTQDAILGEFFTHNTAGKTPAESALRTAVWLTGSLVTIAREAEARMSQHP